MKLSILALILYSSATAFAPDRGVGLHHRAVCWSTRHRYFGSSTALFVSKKIKKREREERARRQAIKDVQLMTMRKELSSKLEELLGEAKKKNKTGGIARAVRRLLRSAQHDGLEDIGQEAKTLAIRTLTMVGRADEAVPLFSDDEESFDLEDPDMVLMALEANAAAGKWDSAARFAERLYNGAEPRFEADLISNDKGVQSLVIESYANANVNLDAAVELFMGEMAVEKKKQLTPQVTNALLEALFRSSKHDEGRQIYQIAGREGTCSDKQTHRHALSLAAALADVQLAMEGLQGLKKLQAKPAQNDVVTALQSCRSLSSTDPIEYLHFAKKLIKASSSNTLSRNDFPFEIISLLLESLDNSDDLMDVIDTSKLVKSASVWPKRLSEEARIKIIPLLEQQSDPDRIEDAVKVLRSLRLTPEAVSRSKNFMPNFSWSAILRMLDHKKDPDDFDLAAAIVTNKEITLDSDIKTVTAQTETLVHMCTDSRHRMPPKDAMKKIEQIFDNLDTANEVPFALERAGAFMLLQGIVEGKEGVNKVYTHMKKSHALSDHEEFQLLLCRYCSLIQSYICVRDFYDLVEILIPRAMVPAADRNRIAGFEGTGFEIGRKAASFMNGLMSAVLSETTRDERGILQTLIELATTCDKSTGTSDCMDKLLRQYHATISFLWTHAQAMPEIFVLDFPTTVSGKELSGMDKIKEDLWGEPCMRSLLDVMREGDCAERWVKQVGANPHQLGSIFGALYDTPIFEREDFKAPYRAVRENVITKTVRFLFEARFPKSRERRKSKTKQRLNDMVDWLTAASWVFLNLELDREHLILADLAPGSGDRYTKELFRIVHRELLDQPVVKSVDDDDLDKALYSFIKERDPGLASSCGIWDRFEPADIIS